MSELPSQRGTMRPGALQRPKRSRTPPPPPPGHQARILAHAERVAREQAELAAAEQAARDE